MNSLNPVYQINRAIYIINLLLYLTIIAGMAFQIILGITQFVSAIYLTFNFYKNVTNFARTLLKTYWLLITLTFISIAFNEKMHTNIGIIIYFIIPMIIATLFMYLFHKCRKEING
jgi:hypothetical protein